MKYFTTELWYKLSSSDKSEREAADLEWINNINAYETYLHTIAKKLPSDTMVAIKECTETLHDFRLSGVSFSSIKSDKKGGRHPQFYKRSCHLQLTDEVTNVELVLHDVTKLCMEIEYGKENRVFDVRWGYCEFFYKKPNIELSVLYDSGHEWKFQFSSLSFIKSSV